MIGKVIKNNYRIMDEIGRGSVATVYLAKDVARNLVIALKIIHPERAAEGQFLQRFQREAKLLQMLTAPQAVKVFDYGEDEGINFIALEYVQGKTLASILEEEGPLKVNEALDFAKQVALCLVDAHAKSIVHRDLRPANIMVTAEGTVKVMDFGVAWGADLSRLTATGALGSPHYLSPEQAGGKEVDNRSDIYSLGVTLFEMLSGKQPYDAKSAVDIVLAHLREPIPSLHQLDERIPLEIDELVKRCLAKKPEDRYQSAAELLEAIDETLRMIARRQEGVIMGMEANLAGQTLGAYRIIEQIGRGGMATVYKAYEPALDRYVAIKILPQYFAHDPDFAARFEREAKAVAKLNHPNILPIYSFGQEAGLTYIAMRYVEAGTLKEMLRLGQPLDLKTTADILGQIGRALDYAHQRGVVHRDVKPTNVLMAEGKWALLTDFGLARMVESSVQLTKSGVGVGTPAYMSPEQGQGIRVDARSDVYSLGVVLYEMVTGRVPYEAETPMAVVIKHITAPLPLLRQVDPDFPEVVERVILKAMAKSPEDRYQTAGEMVEALERAVAEVPMVERPPEVKPVPVEEVPPAVVAEPTPAPATAVPVEAPPVAKRGLPGWVWGVVGVIGVVGAVTLLIVAGGIFLATRGEKPSPTPAATAALAATPIPPAQLGRYRTLEPCEGVTPPQICVRDVETGQVIQVTDSLEFGRILRPAWSPDGQQIVFAAGSDPEVTQRHDSKLYVINADGSDLRQITSGDVSDADPAWSPDRDLIAFHRNCGLWVIRPDGSDERMLLEGSDKFCAMAIVWSPDSGRIAFLNKPDKLALREIQVINRDGIDPRVVHSFERLEWGDIAWNPDGRQIACWYGDGSKEEGLLINADGSGEPKMIDEMPWSWLPNFWPLWGGEELAPLPLAPVSPGGPTMDVREIKPCHWDVGGPGLCIFLPGEGAPTKILTDVELEITRPPSWSPDGQRIAFSAIKPGVSPDSGSRIYTANADGSDLNELPKIGNDISPAWSPDGEWLAFHSGCNLAIMHPDGSDPAVIWSSEGHPCTFEPQWSPDSQWIVVFMQMEGGGEWPFPMTREVWVISRDGATVNTIATTIHENEECVWPEVAFSPDGRQVAYHDANCKPWIANADGSGQAMPLDGFPLWWTSSVHPQWGGKQGLPPAEPIPPAQPERAKLVELCEGVKLPQICVRDIETDQVTQVTSNLEFEQIDGYGYVWSPDGQQIIFSAGADFEVGPHKLYAINADGSDLRPVTSGDTNDIMPAWSPDGQWIAFSRNCGLWLIRPDGSDARSLLEGSDKLCALMMAWSPDSQRIAFSNAPGEAAPPEVWIVNRDGTDPHAVYSFERPLEWVRVSWSPDGGQIACWYLDSGEKKSLLLNADGSGEPKMIDEMPWPWFPDFWPQWGGKE